MSKKPGLIIIAAALIFGGLVYWSIIQDEANFKPYISDQQPTTDNQQPTSAPPPQLGDWVVKFEQFAEEDAIEGGEISGEPSVSPEEVLDQEIAKTKGESKFPAVSKEALFNRLWPKDYIVRLNEWQNMMLKDGFLKESEKSDFKTSEEIYVFLEKSIDYWVQTGVIKPEEVAQKTAGIEKLKKLKMEEAESFIKQTGQSFLNKKNNRCGPGFHENVLAKHFSILLKPFYEIFGLSKPVFAWIMCPDCWKLGAGVGPICGASLWAPCCRCRCGLYPCGCLNAVCACCNAIWDCQTGICGCDIIGAC